MTTVSGGALLAGSSSSFPSGSAFSIGAGATLNLNGFDSGVKSLAGGGSVILGSKTLTLTNASGTFSGNMTSTTGGGLVLTSGTQILSGSNTYNGPTTLNGGTLQAGSTTAFSGNSSFTIASGAILDLNSNNNTVNSLSGSGNVYLTGAGTLLTIANGASQIFSGIMSGAGGFILSSGNLTLQNANTYSGATNVSGGILTVGVANALPASSAVTVAANAELHLGQNSNTIYSLTNSGIVTTSNTITIQGTSLTGGFFTQHSGSTLKLDFPTSSISSVGNISASGVLNLGGTLTVTNSGGAVPSGAFSITLLQGSSPPLGTFTVGPLPFGIIQYTGNQVNLISSGACDGVWGNSAGGNWGTLANWTTPCIPGGTPPNPSDDTATFPNFPNVSQITVTLANGAGSHLPVSIRNINIQGSTTSYTIQPSTGAGSLISLNSTSSMPQIYTTSGSHTIQAPISIDVPSTFNVSGLSLTLSGVVSGASGNTFFKDGTGTLTFSALNTYEAGMWINAGIVEANIGASGSAGAFGSNSDVLVSSGAQLHLGNFDNSVARLIGFPGSYLTSGTGTLTITSADGQGFSGIISGGGGLTLSSTATLQYLSGANTYSGATTIQGGALQALAQGTFSPNSAVQLSTGTLLDLNDFDNSVQSLSGAGTVNLGTAVLQIVNGNNQTFSGLIQGSGGVILQSGTQTLSGLTSNTYSGTTTISGGILSAGSVNILSSDSNILMSNSGSLRLNGHSNKINGLTGATANTVDLGSATLTIMNPTNDLFSGVISGGSGGIILNGGIQILSGQNTYGGATQINAAGTLKAAAANALPSGSDVTVAAGATLDFQNFNNTIHSLTNSGNVFSQATITMGTFNQATVSPGTITLDFPTSSPYAVGNIVTTGSIALGGNLSVPNLVGVAPPPIGTHIVLFQSSGVGSQLTGSFAHTSVPSWAEVIASYATNSVYLQVIGGCGGDWISQSSSDWGISGNWSSGCIPGIQLSSNNDYANFNDLAGISSVTVTLADSTGITALPLTLQAIRLQATTTSFTIRQLNSASIMTLIADHGLTPEITVSAGSHMMDAPISLAQDSTVTFSGGQLTFSSSSQITSTGAFTLSLNQTVNVGGLVNQGQIAPQSVALIGASLNNFGSITPPGPLSASDSQSGSIPSLLNNYATITSGDFVTIGGSTTLNNYGVIQSALAFVIGGAGGTPQVANSGTLNSASAILIESGTINNNPGGSFFAASGNTMFMIGGTINNSQGAVLGELGADIYLAGGLLSNLGSVVSGQYTQLESAALQIGVSTSSQFGNIAASELAFLDGSLTISALPDFLMANGQSIDLITAQEGIVTPFKDIYYQNFPSFINPSVLYLPNSVRLNIQATAPPQPQPHLGGIASIAFISMHQGNHLTLLKLSQLRERMHPGRVLQPSVQSIDVQLDTPPMQERPIAAISFSEDLQTNRKMRNPLIAASTAASLQNGEADRCFVQAQTQSVLLKEEQLRERGKEQPMQPWSVYIGPDASFGHLKSHGDQAGVGYSSAGVIGGMDYVLSQQDETSNRIGFGFIGNYRATSADVQRDQGTIHTDHLHANFYGTIIPGSLPDFFLETIVGYAYAWDTTRRNTGTGLTADGKTHESILNFLFGMEYQFSGNVWSALPKHFAMTPLLTVQYIVDWVDGFTESDAGAYNLRVDACTPQSVTTLFGTRIEYTVGGPRLSLHLELDMGWQREYLHSWFSVNTTAFNVVDQSTQTRIFGPGRNTLLVSGDLLMTMHRGWQIEGTCTYQLNRRFYDAFFYLGFGKKF